MLLFIDALHVMVHIFSLLSKSTLIGATKLTAISMKNDAIPFLLHLK